VGEKKWYQFATAFGTRTNVYQARKKIIGLNRTKTAQMKNPKKFPIQSATKKISY